jgi:hypothetical protein
MPEVRFPEYRTYTATWQEANNAMMALLAGSRLAVHTLQLTAGSLRLLPEIFPAVDYIRRFNLKTETARQLLLNADSHLGAVAVPYALAVHEDFVMTALNMMQAAGLSLKTGKQAVRAFNMHSVFFKTAGVAEPTAIMKQFHLLRHMRNSQIHAGGAISGAMAKVISNLKPSEVSAWESLTGRLPSDIIHQGRLKFVSGDIIAAFAVTKRLGRDINDGLQVALTTQGWAEMAVHDFAKQTNHVRNSDQWMRGLWGYAHYYYGPLHLSNKVLEAAAGALGMWSRAMGSVPPRAAVRQQKKKGGSSS